MERQRKLAVGIWLCVALGGLTFMTLIGPVIFGLAALALTIKWLEERNGERPWWTKSFVTLYRERKSS